MTTLKNSVNLIGRLGNDPEMKTFGENRRMARFSLATNDYYNDSEGNRVTETQWHNIVAWGKTAEIAEKLLNKGKEAHRSGGQRDPDLRKREPEITKPGFYLSF